MLQNRVVPSDPLCTSTDKIRRITVNTCRIQFQIHRLALAKTQFPDFIKQMHL